MPAARAYARDLKTTELHLFDTGHFAPEAEAPAMAALMNTFLANHLSGNQ